MEQRFGFCTSILLALTTHHCDFCLDFFLWIFFSLKFWVTHEECWSGSVNCAENDQCRFMGWYLGSLIFTCSVISFVWISAFKSLTTEDINSLCIFKKWKSWDLFPRVRHGIGHPNNKGLFFRSPYFKNFTLSTHNFFKVICLQQHCQHQAHQIFIKEQTSDEVS